MLEIRFPKDSNEKRPSLPRYDCQLHGVAPKRVLRAQTLHIRALRVRHTSQALQFGWTRQSLSMGIVGSSI